MKFLRFMQKSFLMVLVCLFIQPVFATELSCGGFILKLLDDSGSFSIGYQDSDGKIVDFFTSHDEYTSTFFAVKKGKNIYKLNRDSSVDFSTYSTENSIGLKYEVDKDLQVYVDFSFCPEFDGSTQSVIRVDVTLHNLSTKTQSVMLKGVFDTCLGEFLENHFSTAVNQYVSNEQYYKSMSVEKWIRSSNGKYSVQFLLDGAGITVPSNVLIANKDIVCNSSWLPSAKVGRSFNSVLSYNNSALSVHWNPMLVSPSTKSSVSFYISCSSSGVTPSDANFLGENVQNSALNANDEVVYKDEYGVTYTIGTLQEAQLDPKYIEDLLNRIRWLEAEPEKVDRNELLQLNAELDAILEKIRQL